MFVNKVKRDKWHNRSTLIILIPDDEFRVNKTEINHRLNKKISCIQYIKTLHLFPVKKKRFTYETF
jgi:hypothetical protein